MERSGKRFKQTSHPYAKVDKLLPLLALASLLLLLPPPFTLLFLLLFVPMFASPPFYYQMSLGLSVAYASS
jgi:hypothetical protein